MPRPSAKSKAFKNKLRDKRGRVCSEINNIESVDFSDNASVIPRSLEDFQTWDSYTTDLMNSVLTGDHTEPTLKRPRTIEDVLLDDGSHINPMNKGHYLKTSRTTNWRRAEERKKVDKRATLENFGFTSSGSVEANVLSEAPVREIAHTEQELLDIRMNLDLINVFAKPVMNMQSEGSSVESYNFARYLSVKYYFELRLGGYKKGEASQFAASLFWPNNSKSFRSKTIVRWSKEFIQFKCLSRHSQGAHIKRESFLSLNDVKLAVLEMIRGTKPAERSLVYMIKEINETIPHQSLELSAQLPPQH